MSVYVDSIEEYPDCIISDAAKRFGAVWCHLIADSTHELMDFARKLDLKAGWVQRGGLGKKIVHFDLTPNKRKQAIKLGAVVLTNQELVKLAHRIYVADIPDLPSINSYTTMPHTRP